MVSKIIDDYDPALFTEDINALYENAIHEFDKLVFDEDALHMIGVFEGVMSMLRPEKAPRRYEFHECKAILMEMYQKVGALVEDMDFRRAFIIMCKAVLQAAHIWVDEDDDDSGFEMDEY